MKKGSLRGSRSFANYPFELIRDATDVVDVMSPTKVFK